MEVKKYFRKDRKHNLLQFPHNLAVNEIALAAIELEKQAPHITLHKVLHDWELKREKYRVTLYRNTATKRVSEVAEFTPDLWLDFRIATARRTRQHCLFVEVDMATHTSRELFQKKIAAYCEFLNSGQYMDRFHTTSVQIAYLTPKGEARRDEMKDLCEQQLQYTPVWHPQYYTFGQQTAGTVDADFFLFGAVPPDALNPIDISLSPLAYTLFDGQVQSLLQL
jgi:Replication-relaxation